MSVLTPRQISAAAVALSALGAVAVGALAVRWSAEPATAAATSCAVGVLLWGLLGLPRSLRLIGPPTAAAGAVSLLTTALAVGRATGETDWQGIEQADGVWQLTGIGVLLVLLPAAARWAPRRPAVAAAATAGAACSLWTLPHLDGGPVLRTGACLSWLLVAAVAVGCGAYPRWTAQRQREAVAAARREQQLVLARDLHDYVAHDISGIVVQAQAARFVAAANPAQALAALERIEAAGLHALAAMDRTVQMLHGPAEGRHPSATPAAALPEPPGVAQLAGLVDRFTAAGATVARLRLGPGAAEALTPEAGATAYRVVVEALNNVRRHAPAAERVEVELRLLGGGSVQVRVVNAGGNGGGGGGAGGSRPGLGRRERGRGGRGLRELGAQVRAVGGEFSAGPDGPDGLGWRVVAELGGHRG
ncbi:sensor histidine kinase [Kitasatospora phosalacinea]|uniref:histidine kinase n=1 Tax=Kitasatospora phosalacinea TaxID=2065 RepID=A0ABW6GMJ0_9ACTN